MGLLDYLELGSAFRHDSASGGASLPDDATRSYLRGRSHEASEAPPPWGMAHPGPARRPGGRGAQTAQRGGLGRPGRVRADPQTAGRGGMAHARRALPLEIPNRETAERACLAHASEVAAGLGPAV